MCEQHCNDRGVVGGRFGGFAFDSHFTCELLGNVAEAVMEHVGFHKFGNKLVGTHIPKAYKLNMPRRANPIQQQRIDCQAKRTHWRANCATHTIRGNDQHIAAL
jgi:hypothetical protein